MLILGSNLFKLSHGYFEFFAIFRLQLIYYGLHFKIVCLFLFIFGTAFIK